MRKAVVAMVLLSLFTQWGCANDDNKPKAGRDTEGEQRLAAIREAQNPPDEDDSADLILAALGTMVLLPFVALADGLENSGNSPARAALRMQNPYFADERRKGLADLVVLYKERSAPYVARYRQIARFDPDYTVRAMAIRALNICRDRASTALFIADLNDENELVRLEAAKALANIPDPNAVPALLQLLEGHRKVVVDEQSVEAEEGKDVRIAAADALRRYHTLEVARVLVGYLSEPDFAVATQARHSLVVITGRDLHYDEAAWLGYLTGPDKPLG